MTDSPPKSTTVAQLIEMLQKVPQDKIVMTEGCDCFGFAGIVEPFEDKILITRHE